MQFFHCLNRNKVVCHPNTVQILLQKDRRVFDKVFDHVHKVNVLDLQNETMLITNVKVEVIKNPNIEIHIHDYDRIFSTILKINAVTTSFNFGNNTTKIKYFLYK